MQRASRTLDLSPPRTGRRGTDLARASDPKVTTIDGCDFADFGVPFLRAQ